MLQDVFDVDIQSNFRLDEHWSGKKVSSSNSEFFNYLKVASNNVKQILHQENIELKNSENKIMGQAFNDEEKIENDITKLFLDNILKSLKDKEDDAKWNSAAVQEEYLEKKVKLLEIVIASIENGEINLKILNNFLNELKFSNIELYNSIISNNFLNEKDSFELSNFKNIPLNNIISISAQNLNDAQFNKIKEGGELLNQLIEKIMAMVKNKSMLSTMNLEPAGLDKILLLFENNNNQNNVEIKVDNVEIQKFIKDNLLMIKSALEKVGTKIDNLHIREIKVDFNLPLKENLIKGTSVNEIKENGQSLMNDMQFTNNFINLLDEGSNDSKGFDLLKNNFQQGFESIFSNGVNEIFKKDANLIDKSFDSNKIIDNIVKNVAQSLHNGKMEIEVKLIPENLGKMTIKVAMEEGNLSASIEVKYPEVKHIIETNIIKLRNDLQQNGVHLEKINVFLSDQHQFEGNQSRYFNYKNRNFTVNEDFGIEEKFDYMRYLGYNTIEIIA